MGANPGAHRGRRWLLQPGMHRRRAAAGPPSRGGLALHLPAAAGRCAERGPASQGHEDGRAEKAIRD
eukprot:9059037-Alexandrium_andersonii.AAC.1